jgi:rhomboid protease GluP
LLVNQNKDMSQIKIKIMSETEDFDYNTITIYLLVTNLILYFIAMILSKSLFIMDSRMVVLLAFSPITFNAGFFWTPLTSIFFHAHIAHLLGNCLFLLIYGFNLEERDVHWKNILQAYIITGIGATILSTPLLPENSFQLGASGAVLGLLGLIIGISIKKKTPEWKKTIFVGILFLIMTSTAPNTNIFAHFFGLVLGVLLGYYHKTLFIVKPEKMRKNNPVIKNQE